MEILVGMKHYMICDVMFTMELLIYLEWNTLCDVKVDHGNLS
jgi:hypothetical protein